MFNSMLQSHAKFSEILTEKNKSYIIAGIDLDLLTTVTKFFENFIVHSIFLNLDLSLTSRMWHLPIMLFKMLGK